jgi:hypothetical protein
MKQPDNVDGFIGKSIDYLMDRQAKYDALFAIAYRKKNKELTHQERISPAVWAAHEAVVSRLRDESEPVQANL